LVRRLLKPELMPFKRLAAAFAVVLACLPACAVEDVDDPVESSEAAYSGKLAVMSEISAPPDAVGSWAQPESEGIFGQNGYCGATAASNLLRWYGKEVSPRQAINDGCWSYIGTRPSTLAAYLQNKHAELGCSYRTFSWDADALGALRAAIAAGHPVLIEFMTGQLDAHWVTVIGLRGPDQDPQLVVMSWASFYTLQWSEVMDAWRNAWGGYYPHIYCDAVSTRPAALRVER
jgi:hypothetical protein